jgi:hypothetical protein
MAVGVRRRTPGKAWLCVLLGLAAAGGSALMGARHPTHSLDRGTVPQVGPVALPAAVDTDVPIQPVRVSFRQLQVTAPIVPVTVSPQGALAVPDNPRTVGWWAGGPAPGSAHGTVVLDGHVDSATAGAGTLFRLRNVLVGDTVTLAGSPSSVTYRVTGVREYHKSSLPAATLFSREGAPRLVMITCGGPFDRRTRHYRDNVVAFAVPVPPG